MTMPGRHLFRSPARGIRIRGARVPALRRDAAAAIAVSMAGAGLAAAALGSAGGLGADYPLKVLLLQAGAGWLVWRGLGDAGAHPHESFGAANRVTLARLSLAALLAALVGEPVLRQAVPGDAVRWLVVAAAALTALLDAADGPLARRSGQASAFGARFDLETDAAFTLVLCALVLQAGQTGPWVLASGLMRYAFVAASRYWPWLARALAPSRCRQAVCVVQISTLIVCLAPVVAPALAAVLAAASLGLLAASFAIDIRSLARSRRTTLEA